MSTLFDKYHAQVLPQVQKALEKHYFTPTVHDSLAAALDHLTGSIIDDEVKSVGFGGSTGVGQSDLLVRLSKMPGLKVLDRNNPKLKPEERREMSRQCLLTDLFVASANAVTFDGLVVNLDKFGNRVAGISFGPLKVALIVGRNKICQNLEEARARVKTVAAPLNAMRLNTPTPCARVGRCHDCQGEGRICGVWSVVERSFPIGRIHVLLVNEDLGF
jgi:hypothetical protein